MPLPVASDQMVPGVANFYATTCGGCSSACSLVVKQRDGRPIKIEGNEASSLFGGGTCATGQATVLSLYDDERLRGPRLDGKAATWADVDDHVMKRSRELAATPVRSSSSPGRSRAPARVPSWRPSAPAIRNFRHVVYDPMSASALRAANATSFGAAAVPHFASIGRG